MPGSPTSLGPLYRLYLFGPMRIDTAEGSFALAGANNQRLVGYLALHPRVAHRREALAETLWPDASVAVARRALSDTLYRLRARAGSGWLETSGDSIAIGRAVDVWVDVWDFDRLATGVAHVDLEEAIALHAGELLPGVYDDWALGHRQARRTTLIAALERLIEDDERSVDLQRAVTGARRLIVTEPLHESAHQRYLRLL